MKSYFADGLDNNIREIYAKPRKKKYLKITAPSLNFIFQCDLFFFKDKVILTTIDIYSRRAFAQLIPNKEAGSVLKGLKTVIDKMGVPKVLMVDGGNEFKGVVKEYLKKKNDIELRISEGNSTEIKQIKTKQGIVERYNRTFLSLLRNYLEAEKKINFGQKDLDILNDNYNKHLHSSIGYTPNEIVKGKIPKTKILKKQINKFEIGDTVRLLLQKEIISKDSKTKRVYSKEVYYIISFEDNKFQLSNEQWYPYSRLKLSKEKPTVWLGDKEKKKEEKKERAASKPVLRRSKRIAQLNPRRSLRNKK